MDFRVFYLLLFLTAGCVEPYEFLIKNNEPTLVVEGYISNISYNEFKEYPADDRYFTVRLRLASDVINKKDEVVSGATVKIKNELGEEWSYQESYSIPGTYILEDKDFEVAKEHAYKLQIKLAEGKSYESEWEKIENTISHPIGTIGFEEVEKQAVVVEAGENKVKTIKGVNVFINLPKNDTSTPVFYKWEFNPTWIYIAPLVPVLRDDKVCWATHKNYLSDYALQIDNVGGYKKNLFFMETVRNERIYTNFSVLVKQYAMSEDFFYFWEEMQEQAKAEGVFDKPPFNLKTNITSLERNASVSGYFGVVDEKLTRWYFNVEDLSYVVINTIKPDCEVVYGPGPKAPACLSCLDYHHGDATNIKPLWWEE